MTLLETNGVRKAFGNVVAVDGIDFAIDSGDVVGIIGPNGAGKTTFVNLLTGTLPLDNGSIRFNGTDISSTSTHKRAKRGLVRSFQIPQVCFELSVLKNVRIAILSEKEQNNALFTSLERDDASKQEAITLLDQFGLADKANQPVEEITHGDRKILDVCMSVAMQPQLVVLDEPTSGVASGQKRAVMDEIMDLMRQKNLAVIFISHDMELVADYSDRVVAMSGGQKLTEGSPDTVLEADTVRKQIRGD